MSARIDALDMENGRQLSPISGVIQDTIGSAVGTERVMTVSVLFYCLDNLTLSELNQELGVPN